MKEKLRKFLRPRLAVLLAAALLAASLPAGVLPSAYAVDIELVPAETWEDAVSGEFTENGTALTSYTCYGSDGSAETVTVDHEAELGSRENPISIPDEASLILFGKLKNTEDKYYILDKSGGVYDMQGDTRSMLPLMGTCESNGTPDMPSGSLSFQGTLIGNGAKIQNACIKAPNGNWTHPGLFGCLKNAEVMDLTVSLTFAKQDNYSCYAGGIAAAARGDSSLQRLTVDLTVAENSVYKSVSGLVGGGSGITLTGCTAEVGGSLTVTGL